MAQIDHLVIGANTLEAGAAYLERVLGVRPLPGGRHEGVGTHNMLLGLGPEHYLEVIAPDPGQPTPAQSRPFGLDEPAIRTALEAQPRLVAWVARTTTLDATVARLGPRLGPVFAMRRGDLAWRLAPPAHDLDGTIPTLIAWDADTAVSRLSDSGARLDSLDIEHPDAVTVRTELAARGLDQAVRVRPSPVPRLLARLTRPDGAEAVLGST